jgi:hypothetical protein
VNCALPNTRSRASLFATLLALVAVSLAAWACDERRRQNVPSAGDEVAVHASLMAASADAGKPRSDCYGCHVADYEDAHGPGKRHQVPTTCGVCHLETGYHPIQRVHPWPLTGKHDKADCIACHDQKPPVYEDLSTACVDCHRKEFDESEYPGHEKFALTCADCHSTEAWKGGKKPEKLATAHGHTPSAPAVHSAAQTSVADKPATRPKRKAPAKAPSPAVQHGDAPTSAESSGPTSPSMPASNSASEAPADTTPPSKVEVHAAEREHPESRFPISRGNHTDIDCSDCHAGPGKDSKTNTSCVSCHKRSRYDGRHGDVANYPLADAPAYFCVECHTTGTRRTARR